jgi:hypothetical protein
VAGDVDEVLIGEYRRVHPVPGRALEVRRHRSSDTVRREIRGEVRLLVEDDVRLADASFPRAPIR